MGTSVNQKSPKTVAWDIVREAYDNPDFPMPNVLFQIWRAAVSQQEGDLRAQLAAPFIGEVARAVESFRSPAEAAQRVGAMVTEAKGSSLGFELARRAAMQAAGREGASRVFAERLFAEATNYFISRDISGHLSPDGRLSSVGQIQSFKRQVTDLAVEAVRGLGAPPAQGGEAWATYVSNTIERLRRRV